MALAVLFNQLLQNGLSMAEVKELFSNASELTATLANVANSAGRITAQFDNTTTRYSRVFVYAKIRSGGSAPTGGATYKFYLIRDDSFSTPYRTDGLGTADAAVTSEPTNAQPIGSIVVSNNIDTDFYGDWVVENPGPKFSVVFWNSSGQAISSDEAESFIHVIGVNPEIQ